MQFRRQNVAWIGALSALVATAILGGAPPEMAVFLLSVLGLSAGASFIRLPQAKDIRNVVRSSPIATMKMSPAAREAVERARRRGGSIDPDVTVLDVGLIATQTTEDGMTMRRTRSVSKDDDGVRPFITLNVEPSGAERNVMVRFEIIDQRGEQQYVHEMKVFLRDGDMNLLTDMQLPLLNNPRLLGAGDCDVKVYVDNRLIAVHGFGLNPSEEEIRQGRYGAVDGDEERARMDYMRRRQRLQQQDEEDSQAMPVSLEELMRQQNRRSSER